jgi:FAD/FMN-containing dehydrogenase
VTACEFFTKTAHEIVLRHSRGAQSPFEQIHPYYMLLELEEGPAARRSPDDSTIMETVLEGLFNDDLILDATIASTPSQSKELWGLRENITESIAVHGHARKNDISLAVADLDPFIEKLSVLLADIRTGPLQKEAEKIELVLFGHIGDGNLHINYVTPKSEPFKDFQEKARKIEEKVFALLPPFHGSISAEHGIGLTKKKDLHFSRTPPEIEIMRQIKKLFDPKNIMNPGKIFDL